jgi:hypothetical protein
MSNTFLNRDEMKDLTGRSYVRLQIAALTKMGIPFFVNDVGRPVVARSAVEGRAAAPAPAPKKKWSSNALKAG